MPSGFSNIVVEVGRLMGFGSCRTGYFIFFLWKLMGFGSSIAGFICFALGPSFQKLFGRWNLLKIVVYCMLSSMFSLFNLCASRFRGRFPRVFLLKALVSFLVLLFTSLYSYYDDLAGSKDGEAEGKGHRNILSLISFWSFALMSMSLSIQLQPGFEVGMSNFFLGCMVLGVMKKNLLEGLGVALLCFIVMSIRSYTDFRQEQRRRGGVELEEIAVVGDSLLGETPENLSLVPRPTFHPSSLSTLRRRTVLSTPSMDNLSKLNTLICLDISVPKTLKFDMSSMVPPSLRKPRYLSSHIPIPRAVLSRPLDVKKLKSVDLSRTEYLTLLRSEDDLAKVLKDYGVNYAVRM